MGAYFEKIRLTDWVIPNFLKNAPTAKFQRICAISTAGFRMIDRPMCNVLKRYSGSFAQAGLNLKQCQLLNQSQFAMKAKEKIENRTLLLIDDVFTTGATIRCCARALLEGYPKDVYALTVCRATL